MSEEHGSDGASGGYVASLLAKIGYETNTEGLEKVHHSLERIKHVTEILLGVRILEGIHSLGEKFASTGENLESAAIQTGLTTDALQRLQYAAAQNALSSDEMTGGLVRLNRQLFQAQRGSKQAQSVFASLGLSPDQVASFSSVEDAFYAVEDGINALGSQQQKVGAIMQIFGRGGAKYLKLISEGSTGTQRLGKRAQEVGAIINEQSIENLAKFEDASASARLVLRNFLANFAGAFIPGITRGIRAVEEFFGKNKKIIVDGIAYIANEFQLYAYAAYRVFRIFAEFVRRSLYGGEGIGGAIHGFIESIRDTVLNALSAVFSALNAASSNGSLTQLFDSLKTLMTTAKDAGKDLVETISSIFSMFGQVDTSGITDANRAMVLLLTTLQTIVDTAALALRSFSYFAKGKFGSDLYELLSGAAMDISLNTSQTQRGNTAVLSQSANLMAGGLAAAGAMAGPGGASAVLSTPPVSAAAPSVTLNSKVEVIAAPGMSEKQLAEKMQQSQQKAVREMARDFSSSWLW